MLVLICWQTLLGIRAIEFHEVRYFVGGPLLNRERGNTHLTDWIQYMALAGLGIYIPEYAVTLPGLQLRPLVEPDAYRTVSLVTVSGRSHSSAVGAFVHAAKNYRWEIAHRRRGTAQR